MADASSSDEDHRPLIRYLIWEEPIAFEQDGVVYLTVQPLAEPYSRFNLYIVVEWSHLHTRRVMRDIKGGITHGR